MLFFLARDFPMTETQRQIFQWGKGMSFFKKKKKKEAAAAFASVTASCRENKKDV